MDLQLQDWEEKLFLQKDVIYEQEANAILEFVTKHYDDWKLKLKDQVVERHLY